MTRPQIGIERAHWRETRGLAHLIADAFHNLPPTQWLIPDPIDRHDIMPAYFEILVDHAIRDGVVYTSTDRHAVAVWLPTSPGSTLPLPGYDQRLTTTCGDHVERFRAFDKALDVRHPTTTAYHHLALLAVTPDYQGIGYGTALLDQYHALLDDSGQSAYLEAANPRTRDFYRRHGYAPLGHALTLPDGPLLYPMWRPPRHSRPAQPAALQPR